MSLAWIFVPQPPLPSPCTWETIIKCLINAHLHAEVQKWAKSCSGVGYPGKMRRRITFN